MLASLHTLSADAHRLQCARTATWSVFSRNSAAMRLACPSSSWAVEPCRFWLTLTVASAGTHLALWATAATKTLLVACCTHQVSRLRESLFRLICEVCTHDVQSVNAAAERPLSCQHTLDCQSTENAVPTVATDAFGLNSAETPARLVVEALPEGHSPCRSAPLVVSAGCLLSVASVGRCLHDKRAGRADTLAASSPCRVASMASSVVALGP